jgi:hypothetical protein
MTEQMVAELGAQRFSVPRGSESRGRLEFVRGAVRLAGR